MIYTTTTLINDLKKFPKDTPIENELSCIFKHTCEDEQGNMSYEEYIDYCKKYATKVAIFEGSWEEDNISDIYNILQDYIEGYYPTKITVLSDEYYQLKKLKEIIESEIELLYKLPQKEQTEINMIFSLHRQLLESILERSKENINGENIE